MAIKLDVEGFIGRWAVKNAQGLTLATNTADVVRAAMTVGGPVQGTVWHRSLRRAAIAGEVLAALVGAGRAAPLLTSSHVVEAKSRTYGFTAGDVRHAKSQSLNVKVVRRPGRSVRPSTRAASLADLSKTPIAVLLADPVGEAESQVTYVVNPERLIPVHYSAVPDLIEVHGGPQPPPASNVTSDVVGAFLPGTDIWLGIDAALLKPTLASWRAYFRDRQPTESAADEDDERVSYGRDGHILQVGAELARTYEWSEPDADQGQEMSSA